MVAGVDFKDHFVEIRRVYALLRALRRTRLNRRTRSLSHPGNLEVGPPRVINLASRADRRGQVEEQMRSIGQPHFQIVSGVPHANGSLGCALAHRNLLDGVARDPHEILWIAEDDVVFDASPGEIAACIDEFAKDPGLDVLCLAERTPGPKLPISKTLALTVSTYTTACFLVKPWAIDRLRQSFHESVYFLSLGVPPTKAAIDSHWRLLQYRDMVFCVPRARLVRQRPSYSDIRGIEIDYYRDKR